MLIEIEKIKVKNRIRKDFGDIQELADDIKENGLINPPVITPDTYELIAGERRLRAMQSLGYKQIEVRPMSVKDAEHQLNLEISENETRKDFSKKERIEYAKRLRIIEELKAKERMESGENQYSPKENFPYPSSEGQVRDIVAQKLNLGSGRQLEKEEYIVNNSSSLSSEDFTNWDEGKLSTNKIFNKIKEEKQKAENKIKELEGKLKDEKEDDKYLKTLEKVEKNIEVIKKQVKDEISTEIIAEQTEKYKEDKQFYEGKINDLQELLNMYKKDSDEYTDLKQQIDNLSKEKDDISRQISAATSISGLVVTIENFLKTELSPIKYSRAISEVQENPIVVENLFSIIECVEKWCNEMRSYLPKDKNYIVVESKEIK